jgi:hypothetical protein
MAVTLTEHLSGSLSSCCLHRHLRHSGERDMRAGDIVERPEYNQGGEYRRWRVRTCLLE